MALGQMTAAGQQRKWLSIHNGTVELSENGQKQSFSYVEGRLLPIYTQQRTFGGERVLRWFMDITDEAGETYSISFPYGSGTFKSIVLSLASEQGLTASTIIRITPYLKNNYTNVTVTANGNKLSWVTSELPAVEQVTVGSTQYKDDSKRMTFISSLVGGINAKLRGGNIINTEIQ